MTLKHFAQLALGGAFIIAPMIKPQPLPPPKPAKHVAIDEILSYECARNVSSLVNSIEQFGPLFSDGKLVFTSLEAQDASKMLLVNAGYGIFAISLEDKSVNRIRFELPTAEKGPPRVFFLSYLHGDALHSRYFEYAEGHAPPGKDEYDYALVTPRRADHLQPHLDYSINETAEALITAIGDGRLSRGQISPHKLDGCDHIFRQAPALAKNLRRNLEILEAAVMPPPKPSRLPASVLSSR